MGIFCSVFPQSSPAFGPGVHIRECETLAVWLAAEDHPLAAAADEDVRDYLLLGCIAPDLRQALDTLKAVPTHSRGLAMALLQYALDEEVPKAWLAFAVGHLLHQLSDGVAEALLTPKLTAAALLGGVDVLPEEIHNRL